MIPKILRNSLLKEVLIAVIGLNWSPIELDSIGLQLNWTSPVVAGGEMSGCGSFEGDGEQGETIQNHPLPFLYCGIQLIVTSSNNSYSVLM